MSWELWIAYAVALLARLCDGAYVLLAARARKAFLGAKVVKGVQRVIGALLVGAGAFTALSKRAAE